MKQYRCYLRTILLSALAALVIDAIINFEDYKRGWHAGLNQENVREHTTSKDKIPVEIGKVASMAFHFLSQKVATI